MNALDELLGSPHCAVVFHLILADLLSCEEPLESTARGFGPYPVRLSQIFYTSELSFALVNLKPIVAGEGGVGWGREYSASSRWLIRG